MDTFIEKNFETNTNHTFSLANYFANLQNTIDDEKERKKNQKCKQRVEELVT